MKDETTSSRSALVIRWSRWRQFAMMAASSGLVALTIIGRSVFTSGWSGIPEIVMAACGVLIFVIGMLAFVVAAARLATGAITGRIDRNGIYWARWSARTIPWSEIEAYAIAPHPTETGVKVVNLRLRDPTHWPPDGVAARTMNRWRLPGYGDLTLDVRGTDHTIADVERRFEEIGRQSGTSVDR